MKILYIVTHADSGGAQKYVLALAKKLGGEIAAGGSEEYLFQQATALSIPSHRLRYLTRGINPLKDFLCFFELIRLIVKINPDLVHLNSSKAGVLGSIAGKLCRKKTLFTAHGFFFLENTPVLYKYAYILAEKFATMFRDHIIAVSQKDTDNAISSGIVQRRNITTVYNGLSHINFLDRDEARKKLGLKDELVFANVAQHYHRKGLDTLLESIAALPKSTREKIKLVQIGNGPENSRLHKQIRDLQLSFCVALLGHIPHADRYFKAFDAFILSSRVEGFPFVLLEALQAGLPIIATDVGGNLEAVGKAGVIVPPENPESLSQAINLLIHDADRRRLAQEARIQSTLFSQDKMFRETHKVYESILQDNKTA